MTDTIWKYVLESQQKEYDVPVGGIIRHIGKDTASGLPAIWIQVMSEVVKEKRMFRFIGTGHPCPDRTQWVFIGTAICGEYAWHIYERRAS